MRPQSRFRSWSRAAPWWSPRTFPSGSGARRASASVFPKIEDTAPNKMKKIDKQRTQTVCAYHTGQERHFHPPVAPLRGCRFSRAPARRVRAAFGCPAGPLLSCRLARRARVHRAFVQGIPRGWDGPARRMRRPREDDGGESGGPRAKPRSGWISDDEDRFPVEPVTKSVGPATACRSCSGAWRTSATAT